MTVVLGKEGQLAESTRVFLFYSHAGGEGDTELVPKGDFCLHPTPMRSHIIALFPFPLLQERWIQTRNGGT